jgi:addiction module HigA family antidote
MHKPPHPGDFVRTEILKPLGLSVAGAAKVLGVSRPTLSTLLNGHSDLSGDMALRLEKAFGLGHDPISARSVSAACSRAARRTARRPQAVRTVVDAAARAG